MCLRHNERQTAKWRFRQDSNLQSTVVWHTDPQVILNPQVCLEIYFACCTRSRICCVSFANLLTKPNGRNGGISIYSQMYFDLR